MLDILKTMQINANHRTQYTEEQKSPENHIYFDLSYTQCTKSHLFEWKCRNNVKQHLCQTCLCWKNDGYELDRNAENLIFEKEKSFAR